MNVTEVLDRIKNLSGIGVGYGSDTELARLLCITPQSLNNWKKRNNLEWEKVLQISEER